MKGSVQKTTRIYAFDTLRGLLLLSMIAFHACYDLVYIYGWLSPLNPLFVQCWRLSISGGFLILAGAMSAYSRHNIYRSLRYGLCALLIFCVTTIFRIDTPINFGIIYCMAASSFLAGLLQALLMRLQHMRSHARTYITIICVVCAFVCFCITKDVSTGVLHLGVCDYTLPSVLFETNYVSWLGFPGRDFSSGDYYPLIPYSFLFFAGVFAGAGTKRAVCAHAQLLQALSIPLVTQLGKHALIVYLLHQPLILGCLSLCASASATVQ